MILRDAGVARFSCPEFSVEFPVEAPAVEAPAERPLPRTPAPEVPRDTYDALFRGNKPRLNKAAE